MGGIGLGEVGGLIDICHHRYGDGGWNPEKIWSHYRKQECRITINLRNINGATFEQKLSSEGAAEGADVKVRTILSGKPMPINARTPYYVFLSSKVNNGPNCE
jgi:hypothetical protein